MAWRDETKRETDAKEVRKRKVRVSSSPRVSRPALLLLIQERRQRRGRENSPITTKLILPPFPSFSFSLTSFKIALLSIVIFGSGKIALALALSSWPSSPSRFIPARSSAIEVVGCFEEGGGAAFEPAVGFGLVLSWEEEAEASLVEVVVGLVGLGAEREGRRKEGSGR